MYPSIEMVGTLERVLVDEAIGSLAQCRLDETLGLAVGLRTVGSGEAMFDLQFGASLSLGRDDLSASAIPPWAR
jgi:hypothetical protein